MAEASLVAPITPEHFDYRHAFPVPSSAYLKLPPRDRIEAAIETLIEILDAADPDTDFEETGSEDSFQAHDADGPGDPCADHGGGNVEDEGECETWSHPDDHPAELFIGERH